jgi:putative addiction module component (TIGR02574 family)
MALSADILNLSVPERVTLVEEIWDSIAADAAKLRASAGDLAVVKKRMEEVDAGQVQMVSWEEITTELES